MEAPDDSMSANITFEAFFEDEMDRILRAMYVITGSRAEAEDIVQDAFVSRLSVGRDTGSLVPGTEGPTGPTSRRHLPRDRRGGRVAPSDEEGGLMGTAAGPAVEEGLDTISEHVSLRVPIAAIDASAGGIRRSLEGKRFDTAAAIAVCEDGVLRGLIGTEELLAAPDGSPASEIMNDDPPVVAPGVDQEAAAWTAVQHGAAILAVVDGAGRFLGLVPPHRMLSVLLREHDEDMARLGGFLHDASAARATSRESLLKRYWHRIPWLLIGLAGALVAASLVASFERQLEANVMIAYFIPGIVYMADAVGTQTETIIVRGLSVGVSIREVVRRELLTGLLVGTTLSLLFFPVALLWWRDVDLVIATSLALLMASSIATVVAMILPWLIHRLGGDPAFGSGPLATVLQDLLSVLIYFVAILLIAS